MSLVSKISFVVALIMLLCVNIAFPSEAKTTEEYEAEIESIIQHVKDNNAFADCLDESTPQNMPVGIKKTVGGMDMLIVFDKAVCTSDKAIMEAYMAFEFPGSGKNIVFKGSDIQFYAGGLLNATLQLVSTKPVKIGNMEIELDPQKTHVTFDCNGYKETALSATLKLPQNIFKKENPANRQVIEGQPVTASITGTFENLNDILIEVSLDPFQISGLSGFGFYASSVFVDLSDENNPDLRQTTYNYVKNEYRDEPELWRGVYINTFDVKLPKDFCKDGKSPSIGANDMLIDDNGFTGTITAKNLLSLETGDLGGWQFSMSSLGITMSAGHFDKFGFGGELALPVSENPSPMQYTATITKNGAYEFVVSPPDTTKFDIWAASVNLYANSSVKVASDTNGFLIRAELYGKMNINVGSSKVSVADVEFQKLAIQNHSPKFDIEGFEAKVGNMKGFPIQISELGYKKSEIVKGDGKKVKHGLKLGVSVSLMAAEENGFGATGNFTINGKEDEDGGISSWKYDGIEFNSFSLDSIKCKTFEMNGKLELYKEDPVYGDGMKGSIALTIIDKIGVSATAQFGNVKGYRYWYADAFATFTPGIPIFTAVSMNGFGGGAYYHMDHVHDSTVVLDPSKPTSGKADGEKPGLSLSGDKYVPNKDIGIGLKASILLCVASDNVLNVKAGFDISFLASGALNKISFTGEALLLTQYKPTIKPSETKMYAKSFMEYDNNNKSFFGSLDTYLNLGGVLVGSQPGNYAGHGEIYFGDGQWKIFMGTPKNPIGVKFLGIAEASSYFVTGNVDIPGIPDPPDNVRSILGKGEFSFCRNVSQLSNGGGFAFGASLGINIPKRNFMCFYGSFSAGVGFDLMLVDYGSDAKCVGSNDVLGINGWYSSGQTYAYVQGDIGIHCKIFKKKKDISILDVGVAAILQAQLPNPLYMTGEVGGYYKVLGGLIKGNCNFKFDIGKECEIQRTSSVLDNIEVITDVTPRSGATDVDVFSSPQVTFNYQIDQEFDMVDDVDGKSHKFRIKFDYFDIKQGDNKVKGEYQWNQDHNVVAFESFEVLPGKSTLTASVKVHFQENSGGVWSDVKDNDGNVMAETRDVSFTTGDLPDYIPTKNILHCYPLISQTNFYQNEYSTAFIELKKGQSYLFDKPAGEKWSTEYRYSNGNDTKQNVFAYNSSTKKLVYSIPGGLKNNTVYDVTIVNIPISADDKVDANVKTQIKILATGDTITTRATDGTTRASADEKVILSYQIRTSKYNTFKAKIKGIQYLNSTEGIASEVNHLIGRQYAGEELFSEEEIDGDNPMIVGSFVTSGNDWYQNYAYNLIYKDYPYGVTLSRNDNSLGIPPVNCITYDQYSKVSISKGNNIVWNQSENYIFCYIEDKVAMDYKSIRNGICKLSENSWTDRMKKLLLSSWTTLYSPRKYYVKLSYYIPGQIQPTSSEQLYIEY